MSRPPPREGSRDTSEGLLISKFPDVCRSPVCAVPYTIVAKQSDDANTCTSVYLTSLRAHNQGSIITCCSGDEPGTGLGVVSGTVGSVCHRKEHSQTVRFEGKWATRDGDEWFMNNKNTRGKLRYPKSNKSFDPTPPFIETETNTVKAKSQPQIMNDISPDMPVMGARYALLDTEKFPDPDTTTPPDSPAPEEKPKDEKEKKEKGKPKKGNRFWKLLGAAAVLSGLRGDRLRRQAAEDIPKLNEMGFDLDPSNPDDVEAVAWFEYDLEPASGMGSPQYTEEQALQRLRERVKKMREQKPELEEKTGTPPQEGRTDGNVGITGKDPKRCKKQIGKYKQACPPDETGLPQQDHHIYADFIFRSGARPDSPGFKTNPGKRMGAGGVPVAGSPDFMGAPSICLDAASHAAVHNAIRAQMSSQAASIDSADTLMDISRDELIRRYPECAAQIRKATEGVDAGVRGKNLMGRGREQFSKPDQTRIEGIWGY